MNLKPDDILTRTSGITIQLYSCQEADIIVQGDSIPFSNLVLVVLDYFSKPSSFQDAMKNLQAQSPNKWIEYSGLINNLFRHGALHIVSDNKLEADRKPDSFGSASVHIRMLNDKVRTELFIKAIENTVKKNDIVVDIGTGSGVLAIAAARAGAKKVYAIESGIMADVAQGIISDSAYSDTITVIREWSSRTELPEKAHVLVSEIIGNDPFAENVLQTFKDARKRLLSPHAKIIPEGIKVFLIPVEIRSSMLQNIELNEVDLKNWKKWYNIDFSGLTKLSRNSTVPIFLLDVTRLKRITISGKPILLTEVDFHSFEKTSIEKRASLTNEKNFNGMVIYFELTVGATVLTTHPQFASDSNSWANPVWYFPEAALIQQGEQFELFYKYSTRGRSEVFLNPTKRSDT